MKEYKRPEDAYKKGLTTRESLLIIKDPSSLDSLDDLVTECIGASN